MPIFTAEDFPGRNNMNIVGFVEKAVGPEHRQEEVKIVFFRKEGCSDLMFLN